MLGVLFYFWFAFFEGKPENLKIIERLVLKWGHKKQIIENRETECRTDLLHYCINWQYSCQNNSMLLGFTGGIMNVFWCHLNLVKCIISVRFPWDAFNIRPKVSASKYCLIMYKTCLWHLCFTKISRLTLSCSWVLGRFFPLFPPQTRHFVKHTEHHCFKTIVRIAVQLNFGYEGFSSDIKGFCDHGSYLTLFWERCIFLKGFTSNFFHNVF